MKTGCIFDLDGTLVDSIDDLANSCNLMLQHFNLPIFEMNDYRQFVGSGVKKLIERVLPKEKQNLKEEALDIFYEIYSQNCLQYTTPYPYVIELLKKLKELNIPIAVVSNKPHHLTKHIVNTLFGNLVDVCYGQIEGIEVKPNPTLVIKACKQLGIDREVSFYIGDSDVDILTAKNAKLQSIGCTWGNRSECELINNGANFIAHDALELKEIILERTEFILVSSCLMGKNCKYNGLNNNNMYVQSYLNNFNYICVCPEQLGGLPTPRIPSEVKGQCVINKNNEDVTDYFKLGAKKTLEIVKKYNINQAILKANSPSCGSKYIYDGTFSQLLTKASGITAQLLMQNKVVILDEKDIELKVGKDNKYEKSNHRSK